MLVANGGGGGLYLAPHPEPMFCQELFPRVDNDMQNNTTMGGFSTIRGTILPGVL